jgi:hypothetical protein
MGNHHRSKDKKAKQIKMKGGKKYARLQKIETLSKQQKKIQKKLGRHVKPEEFHRPESYKQGMSVLRQSLQAPAPSATEIAGSQYLQSMLSPQGYLQRMMSQDPQLMEQFEAPYRREFQEQTVPGIAERFTGLDAQRSSAFQQTMGQAGASLMERLASLRGGLGLEAAQMGLGAAQQALGYSSLPFERQSQQANMAQALMQGSILPKEISAERERFAQNLEFQQRQVALGTPPYGYAQIPATPRRPGFVQGAAPGIVGGLGGAAIGAGIGSIVPGIGTAAGAAIGAGIGSRAGGA